MSGPIEREVKLRFASRLDARTAVVATGARLLRERRLQADALFDTDDGRLRRNRCTLRVRREPGACFVTFKGAPQPSIVKRREELETEVADAPAMTLVLERLGFVVWFRYEKFREEFAGDEVTFAIDETPVGTFVEIEGTEASIAGAAAALGRGPEHYILESYRALFLRDCTERGVPPGDMIFHP
jgi:adenylate cyclase class 2